MPSGIVRFCAIALLFNVASTQAAIAGGFGEKFNNWLLGMNAQAATLDDYELDVSAEQCLQCHNGGRATHITVKDANAPMQFSSFGVQVNHPVGMDYDNYATAQSHSYTPGFALDPAIILVAGKVTCVSCHMLKERQPSASANEPEWIGLQDGLVVAEDCSASAILTVGPRETDLCLACHKM